jgi:transaldolase/glucose-6-phosphate isomerase
MNPIRSKTQNPLQSLQTYGQSVWLDYIRRSLITSGELQRLVDEDGLRGVTSNPSIFEKAIVGSTDYKDILEAKGSNGLDAKSLYEKLAIRDIQDAADILRPVYEQSNKRDGYVSLEVSPTLAHDTEGTLQEARRLWKAVGRENVMIKVPATAEGIPAIEALIGEGINVNVTLLFSQQAYEQVAEAYITGLEKFLASGGDVSRVASVASFFISRIDSAIDNIIAARVKGSTEAAKRALLQSLLGKVAIANAKLTYQRYLELFDNPRWQKLAVNGAQTQRVLWASTSTKNPAYRDVSYVEELIGANTVNTIPPATFDAFRDHGRLRKSLIEGIEDAQDTMATLAGVGISMEEVTNKLLDDGVGLFIEAFDKLLGAVGKYSKDSATAKINRQTAKLPANFASAVEASLKDWQATGKVRRLWARDATLWTGEDEANWLGWMGITDDQLAHISHLKNIANEVKEAGFANAALLGMGG